MAIKLGNFLIFGSSVVIHQLIFLLTDQDICSLKIDDRAINLVKIFAAEFNEGKEKLIEIEHKTRHPIYQ